MIRGQQPKVQLLTARNQSDIGKMHRSPLHGLWQDNRTGSPPRAIVIKPIESVYQKINCRNNAKTDNTYQQIMQVRPQSHFLQPVTRGKTPDDRKEPTPNRKGLFQMQLEKNKENLIPNCAPWHFPQGEQKEARQWPLQKISEETTNRAISVNRARKVSMLVTFNPQPAASKGYSIRESDESLLISSALESVNKSSIEDLSFQAYLRPPC